MDSDYETRSDAEVLDDEVDNSTYEPREHRPVKTTPSERIEQERSIPHGQKRKVDHAGRAVCLIECVSRSSVIEYCHVIRRKEPDAAVIGHFSVLFSQLTFISSTIWSIIGACLDIH